MAPILRNELVFDRHSTLALRPALESLKREANDLEIQIRLLQVIIYNCCVCINEIASEFISLLIKFPQ